MNDRPTLETENDTQFELAAWELLREARRERDEAIILGNKLADECDRILGLGLHQNTLPRFKVALRAWRENI